ncbi:redoxin domain-containing protein [Candidatus Nitrosocosmicus agrestis]|jgi:cytochrome c-type biogenesis protein|uniref:redoxin domain-containing protein n=1 Tax=Candidatus Nitrosocosmicus agrestis TaxID=2563600 RepID=UPI00122E911A|nr:cytochrome c biogenesis protein CcdA [Candidatus Nitrosocosmicus sp. SS]KAA2281206.1 redoxin domain-containing protein [Candidatus Nitrosocosmicus sp. SS]KAF0868378.1 redoxin domain-containing protein [Candidatus Nitrosocosmicus sp. SS]
MSSKVDKPSNRFSLTPSVVLIITVFIASSFFIGNISSNHYSYGQTGDDDNSDNNQQSVPKDKVKSYSAQSLENEKPLTIATNTTGKLIILNSWATWCIPCREEMPGLEQLYKEYSKSGLEVVGVSVDSFGMDDRIKAFANNLNITYPLWHDPNDLFTRTFKTIGVPESYLIDKNGTIYHQWKGQFDPISAKTKSLIENTLLEVSPDAFAVQSGNTSSSSDSAGTLPLSSLSSSSTGSSSTNLAPDTDSDLKSNLITIGIPISFAAGLLSFLSPCILPIIPSFVAFITGMSSDELLNKNHKNKSNSLKKQKDSTATAANTANTTKDSITLDSKEMEKQQSVKRISVIKSKTFIRGCLFILGFSIVFVALGASITAIGSAFHDYSRWIEIVGGVMIILFGLNLLGVLKIPGTQRDRGYKFPQRPAGHVGSLLIGMGFGAGWTPCIGPILASILTIAAVTTSLYEGVLLLIVYSAGLAIPFIISALAIDKYLVTYRKLSKYMPWIHRISVALLLIMGVLLLTGYLTIFTTSLAGTFPMLG